MFPDRTFSTFCSRNLIDANTLQARQSELLARISRCGVTKPKQQPLPLLATCEFQLVVDNGKREES